MKRIYLDTNVLSNLKSKPKESYVSLSAAIERYKGNLSFVFSPAHIRDKRKDKTDKKFADFEFMESLVRDNYLSYHASKGKTSFYLATPRTVFDDGVDGKDLASIMDLLPDIFLEENDLLTMGDVKNAWLTDELRKKLASRVLSDDEKALIEKAFPETDRADLQKIAKRLLEFSFDIYTNHETYKTLRKVLDESLNNGEFVLNNELDWNKAFQDSAFQTSFLDFVKVTLTPREDGKVFYYDFFQQCYLFLDMFGIDKDKIKEKNTFVNLFNDSLHAYYGQYCDFFVSEDGSTRKKTKALYALLGIGTVVRDSTELLNEIAVVGPNKEANLIHFFANLWADIAREPEERLGVPAIGEEDSIVYSATVSYLNYFDRVGVGRLERAAFYFLTRSEQPFLRKANYRERGMVVDYCQTIFGLDLYEKGDFNFEKEVSELREGTWPGRYWKACNWLIRLFVDKESDELILTVGELPKD